MDRANQWWEWPYGPPPPAPYRRPDHYVGAEELNQQVKWPPRALRQVVMRHPMWLGSSCADDVQIRHDDALKWDLRGTLTDQQFADALLAARLVDEINSSVRTLPTSCCSDGLSEVSLRAINREGSPSTPCTTLRRNVFAAYVAITQQRYCAECEPFRETTRGYVVVGSLLPIKAIHTPAKLLQPRSDARDTAAWYRAHVVLRDPDGDLPINKILSDLGDTDVLRKIRALEEHPAARFPYQQNMIGDDNA